MYIIAIVLFIFNAGEVDSHYQASDVLAATTLSEQILAYFISFLYTTSSLLFLIYGYLVYQYVQLCLAHTISNSISKPS